MNIHGLKTHVLMLKKLFGKFSFNTFNKYEKKPQKKFLHQKTQIHRTINRIDFFKKFCEGKSVIHFGCTDYPVFNPLKNLHIELAPICKSISGFDIDLEGIETLRKYVDQPYFSEFIDLIDKKYDVCLVPETIEHVDNIRLFLNELDKVNAEVFIITGPNCFSKRYVNRNFEDEIYFNEFVHPDHNCWFSPYTLSNVIKKYTSLEVTSVNLVNQDTMIAVVAKKNC